MSEQAVFYTVKQLAEAGPGAIPDELVSGRHLIYSSPAALAFNSPGAEGFGVKRAGLAVPESVMLIVSPGCCGRNTSLISSKPEYNERFFYLTMDETDIVTGRHLRKIPGAAAEITEWLAGRGKKPAAVLICITCVDALLGTDMESICRKASDAAGVPVIPCYMYALTREGRKPPMVHVRQSIYSLLEPAGRRAGAADLLGFFAPLRESSEIYELLGQAGIHTIREISRCETFEEYKKMSEAEFALVLHPEARAAADDIAERLGIPWIELSRFYDPGRIRRQYMALGRALGAEFDDTKWYDEACRAVAGLREKHPDAVFSVGETVNADPFELSLSLASAGFGVAEIFGTLTAENFRYLKKLAEISPGTRVYSNLHPSMIWYGDDAARRADVAPDSGSAALGARGGKLVALGRDAAWYHPDAPCVRWDSDIQPYGYDAVTGLMDEIMEVLSSNTPT